MRRATLQQFDSHDGTSIAYHYWPGRSPNGKALVLFHRGHEHGARLQHIVDELDIPDFDVFAWDARGHGVSSGRRGYARDFGYFVRDAQAFHEHLLMTYSVAAEDMVIIAQSVGAVIASAWVHDYAPRIRAMVLASPAFSVNLYVPGAIGGLKALQAIKGDFSINSYVKSKLLTHDQARQKSYDADPLISRAIAVNILLELHDAADRVVTDAGAIEVPTLLLISGKDYVVHKAPQHQFFRNLGTSNKAVIELDGFFHDTLGEKDREKAFVPIREFIRKSFVQPMWRADALRDGHLQGMTHDEFKKLGKPLPAISTKALAFGAMRAMLAGPGQRLSNGIRIGMQTGFDSGSMLDCVYRNTPAGTGPIGRAIDRQYLNAIGWRGIRVRQQNLTQMLARAMACVSRNGMAVRMLDIAAGHGRYVLDAVTDAGLTEPDAGASALLRDYSDVNVMAGRALINAMNLQHRVSFEKGDAFDAVDLAALRPRPTIAIVSGLYELFPDNDEVCTSLAGLSKAMDPGACLLYTNQPWHPQLEFIARVLSSHQGGADWIMRRRTQLEMDELVRQAGFTKVTAVADQWGIFTVSLAVRIATPLSDGR